MPRFRVVLRSRGVDEMLHSGGIERDLMRRGENVVQQAKGFAPRVTGRYAGSLEAVPDEHPSRVAVHVRATVPYAGQVEAKYRVLGRSIDAARE